MSDRTRPESRGQMTKIAAHLKWTIPRRCFFLHSFLLFETKALKLPNGIDQANTYKT